MYGDITPGDQTHQDVILLYQNHFKSAFRNMPKDLLPKEGPAQDKDKFEIWQMCGHIFQVFVIIKIHNNAPISGQSPCAEL